MALFFFLFFSDFADMKIKTCQGLKLKDHLFPLIQQVRCLQVMANIAQVEPTWRSVTAQTLRLLEELEASQETTDASYIPLTCDQLGEALKSVSACAFIRGMRL